MMLDHRKTATIDEVEHTAVQLYRAETAIRQALSQALLADSFDRVCKLAESLRKARLDLEAEMIRRDNTDGRWQLTEQHLAARGLIDQEGE